MSDLSVESPGRHSLPLKTAIYGSCVSRDTVGFAEDRRFAIERYIARQSLLSAGSDASAEFPEDHGVSSQFQERMLRDDFAGALEFRLKRLTDVDLLLWDLTDERHGVYRFPDGTVVTRSVDLLNAPAVFSAVKGASHVVFGTDEHFALWSTRTAQFAGFLHRTGLLSRTVALDIAWAEATADGESTPGSMGTSARAANVMFERYWGALRSLDVPILRMAPEEVVADSRHQWGLAPFHYAPQVYAEILRRLAVDHGMGAQPR